MAITVSSTSRTLLLCDFATPQSKTDSSIYFSISLRPWNFYEYNRSQSVSILGRVLNWYHSFFLFSCYHVKLPGFYSDGTEVTVEVDWCVQHLSEEDALGPALDSCLKHYLQLLDRLQVRTTQAETKQSTEPWEKKIPKILLGCCITQQ